MEGADALRKELCDLLARAGMVLRKWRSNSDLLLSLIPNDLRDSSTAVSLQPPNRAPKALGIHWDVKTDSFYVSTPEVPPSSATVTKRLIASATAGVYDVLGLFAPAILPARLLFQETWKCSLSWDKPVPDDLRALWRTWVDDLHSANYHPVPRRLTKLSGVCLEELHGFCNASLVAYGAAIYLRSDYKDKSITTSLITAKARVLPVHPVTIPRAEFVGSPPPDPTPQPHLLRAPDPSLSRLRVDRQRDSPALASQGSTAIGPIRGQQGLQHSTAHPSVIMETRSNRLQPR